jgi:hypothetical protein
MTREICVRLARILRPVLLAIALGSICTTFAEVFSASSGNDRITLTCDGTALIGTACKIETGAQGVSGQATPVRFTSGPTKYAHLLKRGAETFDSRPFPFRPTATDLPLVRGLQWDQCHPAADSLGDVFQLCLPEGSSSDVVLFMRGVCDRCEFEPIVLKKQTVPQQGSASVKVGLPFSFEGFSLGMPAADAIRLRPDAAWRPVTSIQRKRFTARYLEREAQVSVDLDPSSQTVNAIAFLFSESSELACKQAAANVFSQLEALHGKPIGQSVWALPGTNLIWLETCSQSAAHQFYIRYSKL